MLLPHTWDKVRSVMATTSLGHHAHIRILRLGRQKSPGFLAQRKIRTAILPVEERTSSS